MCPTVDCVWTLQFSRLIFSTAWMRTNQFLVAISTSSTSNVRAAKRYMEGLQTGLDSSFRCACMQSGCGYARYIVSDSSQARWYSLQSLWKSDRPMHARRVRRLTCCFRLIPDWPSVVGLAGRTRVQWCCHPDKSTGSRHTGHSANWY